MYILHRISQKTRVKKRSISSPSPINLEIDSPSQLKSLTRGLNNYENEEEMEMDMEFIQIDSIEDYQLCVEKNLLFKLSEICLLKFK